ncbi:MAG: hypothetical protein M3Y08_10455 [Fibrobacterota bacterium]|nr:hypothetical protein [Fibrobacterota bacterium]
MKFATLVPEFSRAILLAAVAVSGIFASPESEPASNRFKTSVYGAMEVGQFVKYHYWQNDLAYSWRQRTILEYHSSYAYSDAFSLELGLGAYMWYYSFPSEYIRSKRDRNNKYVSPYLPVTKVTYLLGDTKDPALAIEFGIFPFKYNSESRNLGEYMFRTGAYPNYIHNDFDFAFTRLTGLHLSRVDFGKWKNEILLNTETDLQPRFDWTFTYLTEFTPSPFLKVGAGVSFTNFLSVNENYTTPKDQPGTSYLTNLHTDSLDIGGGIKVPITVGDTGYYTFKSTKLMARVALNPQALISIPRLGPEDLKIYGEIALLGVKNYPLPTPDDTIMVNSFFADRMQRMPFMFGINVPTFGLLNLLSVEAEWYGLRGPNSIEYRQQHVAVPLPQKVNNNPTEKGSYVNADYDKKDNWKWSVYAKKEFVPGLDLVAQVARDHVRHSVGYAIQKDWEEALTKPNQWWWAAKIAFHY